MQDGLRLVEEPSLLEVVGDERVGFLDVKTGELLHVRQELSIESDGVLERDAFFLAEA